MSASLKYSSREQFEAKQIMIELPGPMDIPGYDQYVLQFHLSGLLMTTQRAVL